MRRVDLNMKEKNIYEIIKKLVDTNGNKHKAAIRLGYTIRYINKLIEKYKKEGKQGFIHKNTGRKPAITIPIKIKKEIIKLYEEKYYDFNWAHFKEKLKDSEKINISYTALRLLLTKEGYISPLCNRLTRKKKKQELTNKKKLTDVDKKVIIDNHILDKEKAHPRKPRAKYFGELIQMDASGIKWFNDIYSTLHLAIDDSTGMVVGAYFDEQETLKGYYNVLNQILTNYGIPNEFLTDRRSVFTYNLLENKIQENDTYTQFAYACKTLGINIKTSSIPQKKGRIERLNGTFQNRLPQELRVAQIKTIEEANNFLILYIKQFNKRFSLYKKNTISVFESQPSKETINLTLAVMASRKFDCGSSIKFKNKYYQAVNASESRVINFKKGTEALVIKTFDERLFVTVDEKIYLLKELAEHKTISKDFDEKKTIEGRIKYIPPMTHPWRKISFDSFISKQQKNYHENES